MEKTSPLVVVSPLAWGLGHATRCVPLIRCLMKRNCRVALVLTQIQQALLQPLFGNAVQYIPFEQSNIHYRFSFGVSMLLQLPTFLRMMRDEQRAVKKIVQELNPALIISDNRYGFWSSTVPSVIVCHQVNLQIGVLSAMGNALHCLLLKRFAEIWVPDFEQSPQLAGALAHPPPKALSVRFIGAPSRMHPAPLGKAVYDVLAILSGPEPERSKLERLLIQCANDTGKKLALIRGTEKPLPTPIPKEIHVVHLAQPHEIEKLVAQSLTVVCRSGYSSLCDLLAMQRKAVLVPTPGQGEQEYLATWFEEQFGFISCKQSHHALVSALRMAENADSAWQPNIAEQADALLESALTEFGI